MPISADSAEFCFCCILKESAESAFFALLINSAESADIGYEKALTRKWWELVRNFKTR